MIKDKGKVHDEVAELLRLRGIDTKGLKIATLGRGTDHLVLIDEETVGEYNYRSKKMTIYRDTKQP